MALTKRDVDRMVYDPDGPKVQYRADGVVPGMSVRIYPSGRKAYVLRYRPGGAINPKLLTLGNVGALTLHQARERARKALADTWSGGDPLAERQNARRAETVQELFDLYLERHAKPHKRTWKADQRRGRLYVLPALGSKKVQDVTHADIARLHQKIGEHAPYEANRTVEVLRTAFNLATDWGIFPEERRNPATRIKRFREKSRDRWVTPEELPRLVEAIDAEESEYVRAAIRLYLLTGLRKSELLNLRWRDIDLTRRTLHIERTKNNNPLTLPLSAAATEIIAALPRQLGNAYLLPGERQGKPLVNISKPWSRIRARFYLASHPDEAVELRAVAEADIARRNKHARIDEFAVSARLLKLAGEAAKESGEDVRLHDLRRTLGSWLATSGDSLPLIGKVLNHASAASTAVYARLADDSVRVALEEHGARMGPILAGTRGG